MKAKVMRILCGGQFVQIKKENQEFDCIFHMDLDKYEVSDSDRQKVKDALKASEIANSFKTICDEIGNLR